MGICAALNQDTRQNICSLRTILKLTEFDDSLLHGLSLLEFNETYVDGTPDQTTGGVATSNVSVKIDDVKKFFVDLMQNDNLGVIANTHHTIPPSNC